MSDLASNVALDSNPRATDFAVVVQTHRGRVYGYLRARLTDPSDAEDLCQEVFLRYFQSRARPDDPQLTGPWLVGIARNVLREHARRLQRRNEVSWTDLCLRLETIDGPDESLYDDMMGHLPTCLDSLGQSAREALDLRYRAKLRLAQIGDRLRRSEGAVKLLMYRARQALRHCLNGIVRDVDE